MVQKREKNADRDPQVSASPTPRSLSYALRGIKTGEDFANLMSAMMSDIIAGTMPPSVANAACNAGGKLLKVVEMQYKFAPPTKLVTGRPQFILSGGGDRDDPE